MHTHTLLHQPAPQPVKFPHLIQTIVLDAVKGVGVALAMFVGLLAGSAVTGALRLPAPAVPPQADISVLVPLMLVCNWAVAIVLGEGVGRLIRGYWPRMLSIWLCAYLLNYLLNTLDGLLFTPQPNLSTSIVSNVIPALFAALATAAFWQPPAGAPAFGQALVEWWEARQPVDWSWRLAVAWLMFPPLYLLMGRLVAPFVLPYYQDPSLNLGLALPTIGVLAAMQVLRGALFLLAVLPIIALSRGSRRGLWLRVGTVIFVQIAIGTVVEGYWLPVALRLPHGLELLADSFMQAGLYVWLLAAPRLAAAPEP